MSELLLLALGTLVLVTIILIAGAAGRRSGGAARTTSAAFRDGTMPGVCVITGADADGWWERSAKSPIGAQWLLLLIGILPFVLVRVLTVKQTHGYLPIACAEAQAREQAAKQARRRRLGKPLVVLLLVASAAGTLTAGWSLLEARSEAAEAVRYDRERWDEVSDQIGAPVDRGFEEEDLVDSTPYLLSEDGCVFYQSRYATDYGNEYANEDADTYVSTSIESCKPSSGFRFDFEDEGNLTVTEERSWTEPLVAARGGEEFAGADDDLGYAIVRVDVNLVAVALFGALAFAAVAVFGLVAVVLPMTKRRARNEVGGFWPKPELALDRTGERLLVRHAHPLFAEALDRTRGPAGPPARAVPPPPVPPGAPVVPTAHPGAPTGPVGMAPPTPPAPAVPVVPVAPAPSPGIRGTLAKKTPPGPPSPPPHQ